jgi:hypothetical protein
MTIGTMLGGARLLALFAALVLVVVLSLDWFAIDASEAPVATQEQVASGILGLLNGYSVEGFHASGWAGLGRLPVVLLFLGAVGVVVGLRLAAVVVAFAALVLLVVDLPLAGDDLIAIRWPAGAGIALAIVLLGCAVWTWRRPGESGEPRAT